MTNRTKLTPARFLLYVVLTVGAVIMLVPFIWMVLTALKSELEIATFSWLPQKFRWDNFVKAMDAAPFLTYFRNSFLIAIGETAVTLILCTMAGYSLAKMHLRRSKMWMNYFIVLLMVPFQIILVPLFLIVKSVPLFGGNDILGQGGIGWLNSWWGSSFRLLQRLSSRSWRDSSTCPSRLSWATRLASTGSESSASSLAS